MGWHAFREPSSMEGCQAQQAGLAAIANINSVETHPEMAYLSARML